MLMSDWRFAAAAIFAVSLVAMSNVLAQETCDAGEACTAEISSECLTRYGAGALSLDEDLIQATPNTSGVGASSQASEDCEMQLLAYRSCLADLAARCASAEAPPIEVNYHVERIEGQAVGADYSFRDFLWATVNGLRYEVVARSDFAISLLDLRDLDLNGTSDALIAYGCGGTGCPDEAAVVLYLDGGHFKVIDLPQEDLKPIFEVVEEDGRPVIVVTSDTLSMSMDHSYQSIGRYVIENATLKTLQVSQSRPIQAERELVVSQFDAHKDATGFVSYGTRISLEMDFNEDGDADTLSCEYWERWRTMSGCRIDIASLPKPIEVRGACKRLGVLARRKNGYREFVCNDNQIISYDPNQQSFE